MKDQVLSINYPLPQPRGGGYKYIELRKQDRPRYIYKYPAGTKVRIKDDVKCHPDFHKGGLLVFQDKFCVDDREYRVGIHVMGLGTCFMFHPDEYEIIK